MSVDLRSRIAAALVFTLAATSATAAETIYRCGSSYSQAPCEGAKAVDVGAPIDAAQRSAARAVAARERQLAAELVRDRHDRERATHPATAMSLSATPPARGASAPARKQASGTKKRRHSTEDGDFVAVAPRTVARK